MSLTSFILGLAIFLILLASILRPIWEGKRPLAKSSELRERAELSGAHESIIRSILDLEQDLQLGKIVQSEFDQQYASLAERGAEILSALAQSPEKHKSKK